jgi:hypothetical protein
VPLVVPALGAGWFAALLPVVGFGFRPPFLRWGFCSEFGSAMVNWRDGDGEREN